MKKLIYITTAAGELLILTGATNGQYRAIRETLDTMYPGATIVAVDNTVKPKKLNINAALKAAGFDRYGDVLTADNEADDDSDTGEEGDADTDTDGAEDVAVATDPAAGQGTDGVVDGSVLDFKPSIGKTLE